MPFRIFEEWSSSAEKSLPENKNLREMLINIVYVIKYNVKVGIY